MNSPVSAELIRRCEERRLCPAVVTTCAILGEAIDSGLIELQQLLDLVRSCNTADELGDELTMLAASTLVGLPPAGRTFRVVGEPEGGA